MANLDEMKPDAKRLLDAARELRGLESFADVARLIGESDQTLTNWKRRGVPKNKILSISEKLGCRPQWLDTGELPMDDKGGPLLSPSADTQVVSNRAESPHTNAEPAPALGAARRVPVVGTAQLGDNGYWAELETPVGFGDGFVEVAVRDNNAYALRCRGDSMKPRIKDGEFVIVEPNQPPNPGDEVLVKAKDGRVMVKELLYIRDEVVHLLSVNETFGKLSIPLEQIDCMHLVTGIVKRAMWRPD